MLETGTVITTPAFELPSKYIIHIVSSRGGESRETLEDRYLAALDRARNERHIHTLVLPLLGNLPRGDPEAVRESARALATVLARAAREPELNLWDMDQLVVACKTQYEHDCVREFLEKEAE